MLAGDGKARMDIPRETIVIDYLGSRGVSASTASKRAVQRRGRSSRGAPRERTNVGMRTKRHNVHRVELHYDARLAKIVELQAI